MNQKQDYIEDDDVIVINDDDAPEGDSPNPDVTITIEGKNPDSGNPKNNTGRPNSSRRRWGRRLAVVAVFIVLCTSLFCWALNRRDLILGVPISVSPSGNIDKLAMAKETDAPSSVIMSHDSILGVSFNLYELRNLSAYLSVEEPDTTDETVLFYSRSCDHANPARYLGSIVMEGTDCDGDFWQTLTDRHGYCAMANGNVVIGVSVSDKVKDYCQEQGGSFFRQYVLLSSGEMPSFFPLRGKVERRAFARDESGRLFYVETLYKETLWDLSDALREYGFIDAIYITGGADYTWWRESVGGEVRELGVPTERHRKAYDGIVPWVIFQAKK